MMVKDARIACPIAGILLACVVAVAADWPDFHGPNRDNVSTETGLLKQWPDGGPKLLWTAKGIGHGFSTVAIADGLIYTTGNVGDDSVITALDLDGKPAWTAKNGPADKHDRPGTRSTPVIEGGRLYNEGSVGDLVCLEAKTGKPLWSLNILTKFSGRDTKWGLAETPLIDGDKLVCVPGGEDVGIVALNKLTGETVWECKGTTEKPGYGSAIAIEFGGVRQYVTMMQKSVVGVRAKDGKLLWKVPHVAFADETASTPVYADGRIVVSTLPPGATQCIELSAAGGRVAAKKAWEQKALADHHGGLVLYDGHVYGSTLKGQSYCLDLKRGRVVHSAMGVGKGSLVYADGMLYTVSEKGGKVGLVTATPDGHDVISQFQIPQQGEGLVWAHPVICDGRLYLRHGDFLYCYDVRAG